MEEENNNRENNKEENNKAKEIVKSFFIVLNFSYCPLINPKTKRLLFFLDFF